MTGIIKITLNETFTTTECGDTLVWLSEARNKKCVTLNLATERGREVQEFLQEDLGDEEVVGDALDLLGLAGVADRLPTDLSHGQRRLAACARAVVGHPSLICMDEPAAGLDSSESRVLGGHLRSIVAHGSSILLVDHDMSMVLEVCDRVYVLEFGEVIAVGTPDEIRRHPAVIAAYLGRSADGGAA
mgnify:CR=1 FL=1